MTSSSDPTRARWVAALRAFPVLGQVGEHELLLLIDEGEIRSYGDGAPLTGHDAALLVVDGACVADDGDGRVRRAAPTLVGAGAVLTGIPEREIVRATGDVRAATLPRDRLLSAIRTSAGAGQELTELVAQRLCEPDSIRLAGRFTVEGIMGEGGSGRVLRARHPLLGIPLALKMLSHALSLSPEGARRFVREASLLVHLDHPGIVRVLDAFEAHGTFFIVMPWLEGATLRAHIDAGVSFGAEQIVELAEEALDALAALHGAGLVHRDVKPSNIFIKPSGRLVLIDFGIACQRDARGHERRFVGTPSYCSPEQILGRPVDGRSDVYSLGCTLYELVFGVPPFDGPDIEQVIQSHLRDAPPFDVAPRVPVGDDFLQWLRQCLSRTRASRPDAVAARASLRALMPTREQTRSTPRARVTVPMPVFLTTGEFSART